MVLSMVGNIGLDSDGQKFELIYRDGRLRIYPEFRFFLKEKNHEPCKLTIFISKKLALSPIDYRP